MGFDYYSVIIITHKSMSRNTVPLMYSPEHIHTSNDSPHAPCVNDYRVSYQTLSSMLYKFNVKCVINIQLPGVTPAALCPSTIKSYICNQHIELHVIVTQSSFGFV